MSTFAVQKDKTMIVRITYLTKMLIDEDNCLVNDKPAKASLKVKPGDVISINIPEKVRGIGNSAFEGCNSLKSITIPNSTLSIGFNIFANCSNLESVDVDLDCFKY